MNCIVSQTSCFHSLLLCTQTNVQYLPSIVLDAEAIVWQAVVSEELGILAEATLKVLVFSTDGVQFVQESLVGDCPWPQALLVQHGQNAILMLGIARSVDIRNCIIYQSWSVTEIYIPYYSLLIPPSLSAVSRTAGDCGFMLNLFMWSLRTGRLTYILNEVADNSIVEIFNVGPLDALYQKKWRSKGQ